jgi:ATP-dependent DNA helicase RecG
LRLKEPLIDETDHSVTVYIRHTPLASPHDTVVAFLENNGEITNMIARDLTGIRSENSMKNVFLALKKRGMIEPVPGKTTGGKAAWRKAKPKRSPKSGH